MKGDAFPYCCEDLETVTFLELTNKKSMGGLRRDEKQDVWACWNHDFKFLGEYKEHDRLLNMN